MARNRKRAKERRARRPAPVVTAGTDRDDETPGPISHATPDVELAEAQLALGRPDLAGQSAADATAAEATEPSDTAEAARGVEPAREAEPADEDPDEAELGLGEEFGEGPDIPGVLPETARIERGELEQIEAPVAEARPRSGNRLINFLQGSWRELQRVQWPDRRQVVQATGVVIGFVIVAGVYLGVADWAAGKIVTFILK